jgi:hypothetical protein
MPRGFAENSATYADEHDEDPGTPDIGRVVVTNDDAGRITFDVEISSHPSLTQDMRIRLWFSDGSPATGLAANGADGYILVDGLLLAFGTAALYRCQDSVCVPTAYSRADAELDFSYARGARFASDVVELGVRIGLSPQLRFWVEVGAGYAYDPATRQFDLTNVRRDVAPSGAGASWTYTVGVGAAALRAQALTIRPRLVRAGERVTARMHVVRVDTGATVRSGVVSCVARAGSVRLRPLSRRFASGRASCVFSVPAGARGKTLRGSISVAVEEATVTRSFTRPIR